MAKAPAPKKKTAAKKTATTRRKAAPRAPARTEPKPYSVSFLMGNDLYSAQAETIIEAIEAIEMPRFLKGKILITVQAGKLKSEMVAYPPFVNRLFANKMAREIFQKRMATTLK